MPQQHVLVLGDQLLVAQGVAQSLRSERVAERVEVYDDPDARYEPDAVVLTALDTPLPSARVLEAARRLQPWRAVLVLEDADPALAAQGTAVGASGFVLASEGPGALADAVRRVASGELVVPSAVLTAVLRAGRGQVPPAPRKEELSAREREVVVLLQVGLSRVDVARRLGISPHTVRTHAQRAAAKLRWAAEPPAVR